MRVLPLSICDGYFDQEARPQNQGRLCLSHDSFPDDKTGTAYNRVLVPAVASLPPSKPSGSQALEPLNNMEKAVGIIQASNKVLAKMACSTHFALWEATQYKFIHEASKEWLTSGTMQGRREGSVSVGVYHGDH